MIGNFGFGSPDNLWFALALLPLCICVFFLNRGRRHLCQSLNLSSLRGEQRAWRFVAAIALLFFSMGQPQWGQKEVRIPTKSLAVVAVLDASPSMLGEDVFPSRITAAQRKVMDLSLGLKNEPMGLVAFSGGAYARSPLTRDKNVLSHLISDTTPHLLRQKGSDLASAIDVAYTLFDQADGRPKAVVVFTDGEDHGSVNPNHLLEWQEMGIPVFSLVFGSSEGAVIPVSDGEFLMNEKGSPVLTRSSTEGLKEIASATDGQCYQATTDSSDVASLLESGLMPLAKKGGFETHVMATEWFFLPLSLAMLLIFAGPISFTGRALRFSQFTLLCFAAFSFWNLPAQSEDDALDEYRNIEALEADALRRLQSGEYSAALQLFQRLLLVQRDDNARQRTLYNSGLAAYRQGQLNLAYRRFQAASDLGAHSKAAANAQATLSEIEQRLQKRSENGQEGAEAADNTDPSQSDGHANSQSNSPSSQGQDSKSSNQTNPIGDPKRDASDKPTQPDDALGSKRESNSEGLKSDQKNVPPTPLTLEEMNQIRAKRIINSVQAGGPLLLKGAGREASKPW